MFRFLRSSCVLLTFSTMVQSLAVDRGASALQFDDSVATNQHPSNATLVRRVNLPPDPPSGNHHDGPLVSWIALGDSFSAGPGTGGNFDDNSVCKRRYGAYAPQLSTSDLFQRGYGNPAFKFLSCSGDVTTNVIANQAPSIANTDNLVTLSIGGNDIFFGKIAKGCIFAIDSRDCQNIIDNSRQTLYSVDFFNNYNNVLLTIQKNSAWCTGVPGKRYDCSTLVYQTAYPSFFVSNTAQCDSARFLPGVGPKITQALRTQLNQLGQELNAALAYWADNYNRKITNVLQHDFIRFVDQGHLYSGHRFCREGVNEPDVNNPNTWFFNFLSNADPSAPTAASVEPTVDASAYSGINPATCDTSNDIGDGLVCTFAQMIQAGDPSPLGGNRWPQALPDEWKIKTFHPTRTGMGATMTEIQQRLNYWPQGGTGTFDAGCTRPYGKKLRILAIGDSITWGFRSSNGAGYRSSLYHDLVDSSICSGNEVQFIGTQSSSPGSPYDLSEGYPGKLVSNIFGFVEGNAFLFNPGPNIVLLMAGTNDINGGNDPIQTAAELGNFVSYLRSQAPTAVILVGTIPSIGTGLAVSPMSTVQENVIKYNAAIAAMIDTRLDANPSERLLKVHISVTGEDHYTDPAGGPDPLHPDDTGYHIIAQDWEEAISDAFDHGWIDDAVDFVTTTGPQKTRCASGLFWDPQGEIANGAGLGANLYPGITCTDVPEHATQCACIDNSDPNAINQIFPLSGRSCADMSYPNATAVHFADLDGDGRAEYLWVGPNGEVTAYYNNGYFDNDASTGPKVDWVPAGQIATGIGGKRAEIRFADLNGDGRAEYLWVQSNGAVIAYLNGGQIKGSPTPANVNWINNSEIASGIGDNGAGTRFADLAGVNRSDYIWVDDNGALAAYLNLGPKIDTGLHAAEVGWLDQGIIATGIGEGRWNTQFADIDGDGRDDYLGVNLVDGSVIEYRNGGGVNQGAQALINITWYPLGTIATGVQTSGLDIQFGDLNGDGRADYISVDPKTSAASLWLNRCTHPAT